MGKQLIIKGADFSQNGIPTRPVIDITSLVFATLFQKAASDSGPAEDSNNRVCTPVMNISSFNGAVGDKLRVVTPYGIVFGIRHGTGTTSVPNNTYWYASNDPQLSQDPYLGSVHTLTNNYLMGVFGKGISRQHANEAVTVSDIQSYISSGQIKLYLEKEE